MTTVIPVPPSLDESSFEQIFEALAPLPPDARVLLDARHARWSSPYGLTALLCVAQSRLALNGGTERPGFAVPENTDTTSYWARTGFFRHAAELFELHGSVPRSRDAHESSVLLELTPIVRSDDVHGHPARPARARRRRDGAVRHDAERGVPEHRRACGTGWLGGGPDVQVHQAARTARRGDRGV